MELNLKIFSPRSGRLFIAPCGSAGLKIVLLNAPRSGRLFLTHPGYLQAAAMRRLFIATFKPRASARGYEQTATTWRQIESEIYPYIE